MSVSKRLPKGIGTEEKEDLIDFQNKILYLRDKYKKNGDEDLHNMVHAMEAKYRHKVINYDARTFVQSVYKVGEKVGYFGKDGNLRKVEIIKFNADTVQGIVSTPKGESVRDIAYTRFFNK